MIRRIPMPLAFTLIALTPAAAASPQEQRGKTFALNNCAKCHSIDKVSPSPLKIAPPFRTLHKRYPIETLSEALAEGISTGHPTMPAFQLDPGPDRRSAGVSEDPRIGGPDRSCWKCSSRCCARVCHPRPGQAKPLRWIKRPKPTER